jgi:hypothetical protein
MLVSSCLEIELILTQDRCTISAEHATGLELFMMHSIELLGDETQVDARLFPFADSANLDAR